MYPKIPNLDHDTVLYEISFSTSYEEFLFQRFHLSAPKEKEKIVFGFPNPIHKE